MIISNLSRYNILENGSIIKISNGQECAQHQNTGGYYRVTLTTDDNKRQSFYVHRLVAIAFLPNPNRFPCVNHKDENKANNSVDNLEWCSYEYNNNYGTKIERMVQARKNNGTYTTPKTAIKIIMKDKKTGEILHYFNSIKEAGRFLGKPPQHINEAIHHKRKSAFGFIWEAQGNEEKTF